MIKTIITDIEGTTTSLAFVHQTLFPYARTRIRSFLREQAGNDAVHQHLLDVEREEHRDLSLREAGEVLERWMDEDRKVTALKTLQGMIWKIGYENGELKGQIYPDAAESLRRWHAAGIHLYVYSSGSEEAQRLIFRYSDQGDMTPLFSDYFDTRIGSKRETASYREILRRTGGIGSESLFLSDIGEELNAAHSAGLHTCQLLRDMQTVPAPEHPQARDFSGVEPLVIG